MSANMREAGAGALRFRRWLRHQAVQMLPEVSMQGQMARVPLHLAAAGPGGPPETPHLCPVQEADAEVRKGWCERGAVVG